MMGDDTARLVEQAREWLDHSMRAYSPSVAGIVAGLADTVEQLIDERDGTREACVNYVRGLIKREGVIARLRIERSEARALVDEWAQRSGEARARVAALEAALATLKTTVEAFDVESTHWQTGPVQGSTAGLAIPDDCDRCEVTIDSDVYEAVLDVLALLDSEETDT